MRQGGGVSKERHTFSDVLNIALIAKAPARETLVSSKKKGTEGGMERVGGERKEKTYCVNFHVGEFASLSTILVSSDGGD